jgi:hypothetical protein
MASELLTNISKDEIERAHYRSRKTFRMDMAHNMAVRFKAGVEEGRIEVARKMLVRGRPIDEIAEDTGLMRAEIEALRAENR